MLSRNSQIEVNENIQTVPTIWVSHKFAHILIITFISRTRWQSSFYFQHVLILKEKIRHPALKWNVESNCMWRHFKVPVILYVWFRALTAQLHWAIMDLNSVKKALIVSSCHETGVTGGKLVHWGTPASVNRRMKDWDNDGRWKWEVSGRKGEGKSTCCCWDEGQWQTNTIE